MKRLEGFKALPCPGTVTLRRNMRRHFKSATMHICEMKEGKAGVDYRKDINIVKSIKGKLLVVIIRNTGKRFLETPPARRSGGHRRRIKKAENKRWQQQNTSTEKAVSR